MPSENAAKSEQMPANTRFKRQFEMLQQPSGQTNSAGRAQAAAVRWPLRAGDCTQRLPEENSAAIDAENFAQEQKKLFGHALGVERVGENPGKPTQNTECLRGGLDWAWFSEFRNC